MAASQSHSRKGEPSPTKVSQLSRSTSVMLWITLTCSMVAGIIGKHSYRCKSRGDPYGRDCDWRFRLAGLSPVSLLLCETGKESPVRVCRLELSLPIASADAWPWVSCRKL